MHIREAEIATAVAIRQLLVIQPHEVQHRGVQVVHVDGFLDRFESELIPPFTPPPAIQTVNP
jgi:hypothetical protein